MLSDFRLASWGLEMIAERLGIEINKALNPLKPRDFSVIVGRLSSSLKNATKGDEANTLRNALDELDVDWPELSEAEKFQVYQAAKQAYAGFLAAQTSANIVFSRSGIVGNTREATAAQLGLNLSFGKTFTSDLSKLLTASQMVYVRDEYGRRSDAMDGLARSIVADSLEAGLGRADIAAALEAGLGEYQIHRSKNYWGIVANDFANKSRTASQIYSMSEAGIEEYEFSAVGDEVTCPACGFLDGKRWSIPIVKQQLEYALQLDDPEDINNKRPFLRAGKVDGKDVAYYVKHGEKYIAAESGKQLISDEALLAAGVTMPPIHSFCRCAILAVI